MAEFQALHIPPDAFEKGGVEVLRAAIIENGLHISLQRAFDEPEAWGMLLADVARHVARIYANETGAAEQSVLETLRGLFNQELDNPTDLGTTEAASH